jgi:mono/diheme cytochrome c family protein
MSLVAGIVGCVMGAAGASAASGPELPPGPNRDLVYGQCRTCHDLQYLKDSAGIPRESWNDILDSMKQYGLRLTPDQRGKILDYLATYLGPNPPPTAPAGEQAQVSAPEKVDGAAIYSAQCAACHQQNGEGAPGQFPPLAKNPDLFLSPDFPARVVLSGLSGKITVNGSDFDSAMPPLGDLLDDRQIAAVVNYVRGAWGNDAVRPKTLAPLDAGAVAELRRMPNLSPAQMHTERMKLKAGAAKD